MASNSLAAPSTLLLVTPEGASVPFVVASTAARIGAFFWDNLLVFGVTFVVTLLAGGFSQTQNSGMGMAIALLTNFLMRSFYWAGAELLWNGQTLGKRLGGLRVIARGGGALTPQMIFTRNLTRDLEVYLPLQALIAPEGLFGESSPLYSYAALAWLGSCALLPLFNRYHLRIGDLLAGTVVIATPEPRLGVELTKWRSQQATLIRFERRHLEVYGISELQVLEDLLRRVDLGGLESEVSEALSAAIIQKIGWKGPTIASEAFLLAFYQAQRAHLEQDLLFGKRKESKNA